MKISIYKKLPLLILPVFASGCIDTASSPTMQQGTILVNEVVTVCGAMVGGEAEQFERAMPYLQAMGKSITHVGGNGAGQMVKLVNQILVANSMLALGEAFLFAQAGGLDLEKTLKAVEGGAAGSWTLSNRGPQVIERDWRPGFMIDLQQKDIRLILEAADALGVPLLGCSTAFHLYRTLQNQGGGAEGNHALVKALENMAGFQVGALPPE